MLSLWGVRRSCNGFCSFFFFGKVKQQSLIVLVLCLPPLFQVFTIFETN